MEWWGAELLTEEGLTTQEGSSTHLDLSEPLLDSIFLFPSVMFLFIFVNLTQTGVIWKEEMSIKKL